MFFRLARFIPDQETLAAYLFLTWRVLCSRNAPVWEESGRQRWKRGSLVFVTTEGQVGLDEMISSGARSPVFQDSAAVWISVHTRAQLQAAPCCRHLVAEGALHRRAGTK